MPSTAAKIREFLDAQGATPTAAAAATTAIAAAWANREFWMSATAVPLRKCSASSPGMTGTPAELVDQLSRHCEVHVHDVAAWDPNPGWEVA